jgi:hypothetical protein
VNAFVFKEMFLATMVDAMKVFFITISISYKAAPVEFHLKIELSAIELVLFAGEARVGAPAIVVVKLQTADHSLFVDELFAFTLQKYLVLAVRPVKLRELVVTIFFAETRFANATTPAVCRFAPVCHLSCLLCLTSYVLHLTSVF